ncbi:VCBS repeat-containing protein [bacterium]|nr:VCBS repeat-containing protein [bacterium]
MKAVRAATCVCLVLATAFAASSVASSSATERLVDNRIKPVIIDHQPPVQWLFGSTANAGITTPWNASNRMDVLEPLSNIVTAATSADMNRDGIIELVIATDSGVNYLVAIPEPGSNVYSEWTGPAGAVSICAGDLNNDGMLDLVAARPDGQNAVLINKDAGTNYTPHALGTLSRSSLAIRLGDLNRDGWLDILEINTGVNRALAYFNDGTGTNWTKPGLIVGQNVDATDAQIGDFDGNGVDDIVVVSGNEWPNYLYVNDGTGSNYVPVVLNPRGVTQGVALGDLNNDGLLDIVEVNALGGLDNGRDIIYIANAPGTNFTVLDTVLSAGDNSSCVSISDMNNDGAPDIIVGIDDSTPSALYLNAGSGAAFARYNVQDVGDASSVLAADWAYDGADDLLFITAAQTPLPFRNTIAGLSNAVMQAAYRVVLNDIGLSLSTQVWDSGLIDGAYHGVWNSGVILSSLTHSSEYAWQLQLVSSIQVTGEWTEPSRFTYRMSNDYCEFHGMPEVVEAGGTVGQPGGALSVQGVASPSVTSITLTNHSSGQALPVTPGQHWSLTNIPFTFFSDVTNELHAIGRTAAGRTPADVLTVVLTNRGISIVSPPDGSVTGLFALTLRWDLPAFVTSTNWVSVRWTYIITNTTLTNIWFTPDTITSTPVRLAMGTNVWQVAYRTPQGIAETSPESRVMLDTDGIRLLSPANGTITNVTALQLEWALPPFVTETNWVSVNWIGSTNELPVDIWFTPGATNMASLPVPLNFGTNQWRVAYAVPNGTNEIAPQIITETSEFWFVHLDTNPPIADLVWPPDGGVVNTNIVKFDYRVFDDQPSNTAYSATSGVARVDFIFWSDTLAFTTTLYSWVESPLVLNEYTGLPFNPLEDGTNYAWQLKVWDWAGNVLLSGTNKFTVAATTIAPVSPKDMAWVNTPVVEFIWSVPSVWTITTDTYAEIELNGNPWVAADTITTAVQNVFGGTNTWRVRVHFPSGQIVTSALWRVMFEDSPPVGVLLHPGANRFVMPGNIVFDYQLADTNSIWQSGIAGARFHFVAPGTSMWVALEGIEMIPATNQYSTLPFNPLTNETGLIYAWQLEITDVAGNVGTTEYAWFGIDVTPPVIEITAPYGGIDFTTNSLDWMFTGVATDAHDFIDYITWENATQGTNGILPGLDLWAIGADQLGLAEGSNLIAFTAYDSAGHATTDSALVTLDLSPPLIAVTFPTGSQPFVVFGYSFSLEGTAVDRYAPIASLAWTNIDNGVGGLLPTDTGAWSIAGIDLQLPFGVSNVIEINGRDIYGWATSVTVSIILSASSNEVPIIANWPAHIGVTQTGYIEFVTITNDEYSVRLGGDPHSVELVNLVATSDYARVAFSLAEHGMFPKQWPLIRVVNLTKGEASLMPRPFLIVDEAQIDLTGQKPMTDIDHDKVYFRLDPLGAATAHVEGHSLFINGMTEPAKLKIWVKRFYGDGYATLPYLAADGSFQKIAIQRCSIDEIHLTGSVSSVSIKGGTLGYLHGRAAQIVHGLACYEPTPETGLRKVIVAGKAGHGGEMLGRIFAPMSFRNAGATLIARKGLLTGVCIGEWFKELNADTIQDCAVFALTNGPDGYAIRKVKSRYLWDTGLAASDFVTNAQTLFVAGMSPDECWALASATGSFAGIIPSGSIKAVSVRSLFPSPQGVFILSTPPAPRKTPRALEGDKEYWYIDGKRMNPGWNAK